MLYGKLPQPAAYFRGSVLHADIKYCEKHIGTEIGKLFAEIKEHIDLRNYNNLRQKRVVRVSADLIKTIPFVKMKYAICLHSDCRLRANWCAEDNTAPLLCCNHKPPEFKQYRKKYGLRASARLFLRFRNTDSAATRERKIKTKNRDKIHALIKKNTIAMISKLFMIPAVSEV